MCKVRVTNTSAADDIVWVRVADLKARTTRVASR
jgi:hypothetical protein